jgi:hypothetical protein
LTIFHWWAKIMIKVLITAGGEFGTRFFFQTLKKYRFVELIIDTILNKKKKIIPFCQEYPMCILHFETSEVNTV